ncbi:MAG TPA: LacI family DNA-binding transcriptional regulator [Verrucomicrobiae bacterium]|nr:LacI family DNA-binding transcriptional regulator [Verrucomicrobiae bacterium]
MSIVQIAKLAGVSTATVSRVLNESDVVSEATVAKVHQAMKRMDYHPPPLGSRRGPKAHLHARLQHRAIAFLWTAAYKPGMGRDLEASPANGTPTGFTWPGGQEPAETLTGHALLQGAAAALRMHRISLTIDYLYHSGCLPAIVENQKVDGLVLHGPEPEESIAAKLRQVPSVWLLSSGATTWGDRVQPDHRAVAVKALDYFASRGCRNVCCITYRPTVRGNRYHTERANSFEQHSRLRHISPITLGMEVDEPTDSQGLFSAAERLVEQFVKLKPRPEGLFVSNNLGYYVHEHLRRRGVEPMKDVLYVCGDREVVYQHMEPEPAKVDIHSHEIGKLAVELLIVRLANPDSPRITLMVEPTLVIPGVSR